MGAGGAGFNAQWDADFVHHVRRAVIAHDDKFRDLGEVSGDQSIYLTQVGGTLYAKDVVSNTGDIRITVPTFDFTIVEDGSIIAPDGSVTVRAGGNVQTPSTSVINAGKSVDIYGDWGDQGDGTSIVTYGSILAPTVDIHGGSGDNSIMIDGGGQNYHIYGSAPNEEIIGSPGGGDYIQGGPAGDTIWGRGAVGNTIYAGGGTDTIYGGSGNDTIYGGTGSDTIYGGTGNNVIHGGSGDNVIYGGTGTDTIYGGTGSNEIHGSALGSIIYGGSGSNIIYGGSGGLDVIYGGTAPNTIYGGGGDNWIYGGPGDDTIVGGPGNNTIIGGGGADLLEGGPGNNIIYGNVASAGGTNATAYIYGGNGTNEMYGGANDLIFGTNSANPASSGNASDLVAPTVTPAAPGTASEADPNATGTLPTGPTYSGWWGEIAGSASGNGLTGGVAAACDPVVAVDSSGTRYVAWEDSRNGNPEIYVARQSADGWEMLGGSAQGGGVSATAGSSADPSLTIDSTGAPIVAWAETTGSTTDILAARYDSASNTWVALGDSLSTGGLSQTGKATSPQIVMTGAGPVVTWLDGTGGTTQVMASRLNGSAWTALGSGSVTQAAVGVEDYCLTTDGTKIAVAWTQMNGGQTDVYAKEFDGGTWIGLAGSDTGGGISNDPTDSSEATAAYFGGEPLCRLVRPGDRLRADLCEALRRHPVAVGGHGRGSGRGRECDEPNGCISPSRL